MQIKVSRLSLINNLKNLNLTNKLLLLEATEKSLEITISNEFTVTRTFIVENIEIVAIGSLIMQANLFFEIIDKLRTDEISIACTGNKAKIKSGQTQMDVSVLDAIAKRTVEKPENWLFTLDGQVLKSFIKCVMHAVDKKDSTNVALTGVRLKLESDCLSVTGCNGSQLAHLRTEIQDSPEFEIVISEEHAKLLQGFIHDGDALRFAIKGNDAVFATDTHTFYLRLLDAKFPPVDSLLDKEVIASAIVNVDDLVKSIDISTIAAHRAKGGIVEILVKLADNTLSIMSKSQLGRSVDIVPLSNCEGANVSVVCDARFLRSAVKSADRESVKIGFVGHEAPIIIDSQKFGKFLIQARRKGREWDGE
ncbi:DNA polymerase III subunit beta family protein [Paenibacillus selenitireducens]|nr:hypothetical protein [Paenibacillus selenitireducens]